MSRGRHRENIDIIFFSTSLIFKIKWTLRICEHVFSMNDSLINSAHNMFTEAAEIVSWSWKIHYENTQELKRFRTITSKFHWGIPWCQWLAFTGELRCLSESEWGDTGCCLLSQATSATWSSYKGIASYWFFLILIPVPQHAAESLSFNKD